MSQRPVSGYRLVALLAFVLAASPRPCHAVPPSPRVIEAERAAGREGLSGRAPALYQAAKLQGVDRIYRQFRLSAADFAQGRNAYRNVLVILCDFDADSYGPAIHPSMASTEAYYDSLFFSENPSDGITSLREYYRENSQGHLIISGQVTTWLTMPHSYAYYANGQSGLDFGAYPRSAQGLAEDAMKAAYEALGQNLTFFDNDGPDGLPHSGDDDGYVDAVCVIHPGAGAELNPSPSYGSQLWSHEAGISFNGCPGTVSGSDCLPGLVLGDVRGFLYLMTPEYNQGPHDLAVGTYFHEFAHTIGLPDLYDPSAAGLGFYSLMGLGNYLPYAPGLVLGSHPCNLDGWSRQFIGLDVPDVPVASGSQNLVPAAQGGRSLKVWTDGEPGTEYFLMESRAKTGSDQYLPGAGLLVYHVDDTQIDNLSHPLRVAVVQADGRNDLGSPWGNFGDAGDFFPGSTLNRDWNEATNPSSRAYSGLDTQVRMSGVTESGAGGVSFNLSVSTTPAFQVSAYRIEDGGNHFPDAGERDSLFLTVRNAGSASGPASFILATTDPFVTVEQATSASGPVATGTSAPLVQPLVLLVGTPSELPHVVPLTLGWTSGSASGSVTFSLAIGMRAGLDERFEGAAAGWTHSSLRIGGPDQWHLSSSRAAEGTRSMKLGSTNALGEGTDDDQTYAPLQDAALVSPVFQLQRGSKLTCSSWIDAETNGGGSAWDGARIEIAVNGGPWRPVSVSGGYGYVVMYNSASALRGQAAFSGSPQTWRRVTADLSGLEGAAQLRFRFSSDETNWPTDALGNQTRVYEGWYVDDVRVSNELEAALDLDPHVVNLASHAPWITAYIEPLGFSPADIDPASLRLAGSVAAEGKFATVGDHDADGTPDLMVKFSRPALDRLLSVGVNELELTGSLVTGEAFRGRAEIRVIDPPDSRASVSVFPNPLNPAGWLRFQTTRSGPAKVVLFDARGRVVRRLLDAPALGLGIHVVPLDGAGDQGEPLASGIYFYTIDAGGISATGRLAVLK